MKLTSLCTIAFTTIPSQVFHAGMNTTDFFIFIYVFFHCKPACLEMHYLQYPTSKFLHPRNIYYDQSYNYPPKNSVFVAGINTSVGGRRVSNNSDNNDYSRDNTAASPTLYISRCLKKAFCIMSDAPHPAHSLFTFSLLSPCTL